MNRELMHVIDQISFERGLDRNEVVQALETALISASRKRLGPEGQLGWPGTRARAMRKSFLSSTALNGRCLVIRL